MAAEVPADTAICVIVLKYPVLFTVLLFGPATISTKATPEEFVPVIVKFLPDSSAVPVIVTCLGCCAAEVVKFTLPPSAKAPFIVRLTALPGV